MDFRRAEFLELIWIRVSAFCNKIELELEPLKLGKSRIRCLIYSRAPG